MDGRQRSALQWAAMGSSAQLACWWLTEAESESCVHGQILVKARKFDGDRVVGSAAGAGGRETFASSRGMFIVDARITRVSLRGPWLVPCLSLGCP